MIKIKFLNYFPSDDIVKYWIETWSCFKYPDVIVYKNEKEKLIFIDNSAIEKSDLFSSVFSEIINLKNVWIAAYNVKDMQNFTCYDCEENAFKLDYRLSLTWKDSYKSFLLSKYKILKSVSASVEYIRFSLTMNIKGSEKIIDKTWNPSDEELNLYDSFDDSEMLNLQ